MRFVVLIASTSFSMFATTAAADEQPPAPAPSPVKRASFDRSAPRGDQQRVTFGKRPAQVGDEVEQTLSVEMRMATTMRQGNQIGEQNRTTARKNHRRVVTATHVESDRAVAVRVRYQAAEKLLSAGEGAQVSVETQPVAEKTYLCQREPGKNGKLTITDEAGAIPPADEYEIVAQHMEMVGRPNPLVELLAGMTVTVGRPVALPARVANKVFNLGDQFGEVGSFTLTLKNVEHRDGTSVASFDARIDATSNNASQMRLLMEGPMEIEVDTCRTVKVDLSGPIAMSETRGSYSTAYQVIGTGQLKMSVASTYRDAKR